MSTYTDLLFSISINKVFSDNPDIVFGVLRSDNELANELVRLQREIIRRSSVLREFVYQKGGIEVPNFGLKSLESDVEEWRPVPMVDQTASLQMEKSILEKKANSLRDYTYEQIQFMYNHPKRDEFVASLDVSKSHKKNLQNKFWRMKNPDRLIAYAATRYLKEIENANAER
jgi:hypothetical protein